MINDIFLGAGIGVLLTLVLSLPALVHELCRRHHGHPLLIDVHMWRGRKLTDRETFALGLLLHLVLGFGFGALYPLAPELWVFAGPAYGLASVSVYGLALFLFACFVVFPLLGLGVFGTREDTWVWLETGISMVLLVLGYTVVVQWFQPSWFL